tara:strand:+ start:1305 stop:2243 length:939 start_codon:yes stop_codon:yes gene_type:complete
MENKKNFLSAVIACYKDAQSIPIMHQRLSDIFSKIDCNYEIIFINDGSPDNSEEVLEKICEKDKKTKAIIHSRNFSSQNSFTIGMKEAKGDAVILLDGDLQDPPEMISKFFEKWKEGYEVVYGVREKRETSFLTNLSYKLFYRVFRKLSYLNVPLDAGDFSLMDRKVVDAINSLDERDRFIRGMRSWVGFKQIGVKYTRPERLFGKSTNNVLKNIRWAKKGIFSFSFVPLEAISYISYFFFFVSIFGLFFYLISYFLKPGAPEGITTLIILVIFLGGIQLLALGIVAEYVGKILEETKKRPNSILKRIINKN